MSKLNEDKYIGDTRYEKVLEQMQLLGIEDITTYRQEKNGTIVWRLPIKDQDTGILIEVASFVSGYVRNQGKSCHSNYQLNKRCQGEPEYFELPSGDYRKFSTRSCVLIPIEIDRLEYLISYCLKNYYIKNANRIADGDYIPKWRYDNLKDKYKKLDNFYEASKRFDDSMYEGRDDRVKELENKLQSIIRTARH